MRKFIVKHFALYYRFKIFGTTFTSLRCTRIMFPYFVMMALIVVFDTNYPEIQWYDILIYAIWALLCWLGFNILGLGYFSKWPVKREELDDEQKRDYDTFQNLSK